MEKGKRIERFLYPEVAYKVVQREELQSRVRKLGKSWGMEELCEICVKL